MVCEVQQPEVLHSVICNMQVKIYPGTGKACWLVRHRVGGNSAQ